MSRIIRVLAPLALVCAAMLIPAAGPASASAGIMLGADSGTNGARADRQVSQSASTLATGNENASVTGVGYCSDINVNADCWTWENDNAVPCPSSHFCIYTEVSASWTSKVFSFWHCRRNGSDWAMQNWNGDGFYHNNNSGGAHAYIKGVNHNVLVNVPVGGFSSYNFVPAWYIQAC